MQDIKKAQIYENIPSLENANIPDRFFRFLLWKLVIGETLKVLSSNQKFGADFKVTQVYDQRLPEAAIRGVLWKRCS